MEVIEGVSETNITIPIYDCHVRVLVADDETCFEQACMEVGYTHDVEGAEAIAVHYPSNISNYALVFRKDSMSPGNIAHESFHIVEKICMHLGINYVSLNNEPMAYLLGFLVDCVTKIKDR